MHGGMEARRHGLNSFIRLPDLPRPDGPGGWRRRACRPSAASRRIANLLLFTNLAAGWWVRETVRSKSKQQPSTAIGQTSTDIDKRQAVARFVCPARRAVARKHTLSPNFGSCTRPDEY